MHAGDRVSCLTMLGYLAQLGPQHASRPSDGCWWKLYSQLMEAGKSFIGTAACLEQLLACTCSMCRVVAQSNRPLLQRLHGIQILPQAYML